MTFSIILRRLDRKKDQAQKPIPVTRYEIDWNETERNRKKRKSDDEYQPKHFIWFIYLHARIVK